VCKCREGNDEQGRECSKQQRDHCCAEANSFSIAAGVRPKLALRGSEVLLHSANTLYNQCLFGETVHAAAFPWILG